MHGFCSLRKLRKAMTVFAVVALFFGVGFLGGNAIAGNHPPCTDRKITQIALAKQGFAYLGTFITSENMVIQLYIHQSGALAIIGITEDLQACILVTGDEYALPIEREG